MAAPVTLAQYAAAWWLMPIGYGLLFVMPSVMLPGDNLGIRRFRTPPLGPNIRLGQTFVMPTDGLHAIDVSPVGAGTRPAGDVLFELYELHDAGFERVATRVRSLEVPAEDLLGGSSYGFDFTPILDSKDRTYRLDLVPSPAQGVAFWATKGERYPGGRMQVNGRERWADLVFRVHAPIPSVWERLMTLHERSPARVYAVVAAFAGLSLLVPLVLHALAGILPTRSYSNDAH